MIHLEPRHALTAPGPAAATHDGGFVGRVGRATPLTRAAALLAVCASASAALAIDQAHRDRALAMIARTGDYLRTQQHESGGWSIPDDPSAPLLPAITGLVVSALALEPAGDDDHEYNAAKADAMSSGVGFILSNVRADGGIYAGILPSYNTAICVSALARFREHNPEAEAAIGPALRFLRGLQWGEDAATNPDGTPRVAGEAVARVQPDHPFYGGVGYGSHGRPDSSNLGFVTQAFHDAGIDRDDPVFQRALVFLRRTQMHEAVNDAEYAKGSRQGGFIYATAETGADAGMGQSQAGVIEETMDDGTSVSRLRAYGSMTYSGFKTMIYAGLSPEDDRVRLALEWIGKNYSVEENPGNGTSGLYYYYLVFARALEASGMKNIEVSIATDHVETSDVPGLRAGPGGRNLRPVGSARFDPRRGVVEFECDWANDLIDQLATLQNEDGSFRSVNPRWMEGDPVLISAYAMLALEHAAGLGGE